MKLWKTALLASNFVTTGFLFYFFLEILFSNAHSIILFEPNIPLLILEACLSGVFMALDLLWLTFTLHRSFK